MGHEWGPGVDDYQSVCLRCGMVRVYDLTLDPENPFYTYSRGFQNQRGGDEPQCVGYPLSEAIALTDLTPACLLEYLAVIAVCVKIDPKAFEYSLKRWLKSQGLVFHRKQNLNQIIASLTDEWVMFLAVGLYRGLYGLESDGGNPTIVKPLPQLTGLSQADIEASSAPPIDLTNPHDRHLHLV